MIEYCEKIVIFLLILSIAIKGQFNNNNCDPGICGQIPGLFYNVDLDQCAWPDEIGCSLKDLGYDTSCDGISAYGLKPLDFQFTNIPEGRSADQYFLVCVPSTTEDDILTKNQLPTGPIMPRLLGCPSMQIFNPETQKCE